MMCSLAHCHYTEIIKANILPISTGVEPGKASFAMHALLTNHYVCGASYPRGGASEIAFHIIPVIEKSGGKVLVRAPVSEVLFDHKGKAIGELSQMNKHVCVSVIIL